MFRNSKDNSIDLKHLFPCIVLFSFGILLFLSLISYTPDDLPVFGLFSDFSPTGEALDPRENFVGAFGAFLSFISLQLFGWGTYFLIFFLLLWSWLLFRRNDFLLIHKISWTILFLSLISLLAIQPFFVEALTRSMNKLSLWGIGGVIGYAVGELFFERLFGFIGAFFLLSTIYLSSLFFCTRINPLESLLTLGSRGISLLQSFCSSRWKEFLSFLKRKKPKVSLNSQKSKKPLSLKRKKKIKREIPILAKKVPVSDEIKQETSPAFIPKEEPASLSKKIESQLSSKTKISENFASESASEQIPYQLPSIDLLNESIFQERGENASDLEEIQGKIISTLKEFQIQVQRGDITQGPTVTRYEFIPSAGLRMNKITQLEADLARVTKAEKIHILAPVPGKDTVGIDIANSSRSPVLLRDLLNGDEFNNIRGVPFALGKDVYGKPVIADLATMPHLLIAGATGSGKSVSINALLLSLLYRFAPEDLKLILIDPKMVEMQVYSPLPHLALPVVTEAKKVVSALSWAVAEMQKRYAFFSKIGVRNITQFREYAEKKQGEDAYKMPYLIIIIDELADLMQVASADIELAVVRLAQKARAAGIHLVLATQSPRADVITGLIKANIPCRIAFQVSSKLDSRIILDEGGAEKLTGMGDMLYLPPGSAKQERSQGAFVSEEEVRKVVAFCSNQCRQSFNEEARKQIQNTEIRKEEGDISDEDNEILERCIEVIRQEKKASTSLFQRRLRLGYTRAARMIDILEERGVIGPGEGAKPREILIEIESRISKRDF